MTKPALLFALLCSCISLYAAEPARRSLEAVRVSAPPRIDGLPDDPEWALAQTASDFRQITPVPGAPSSQLTEVRVLYDDAAIYVSAWMQEVSRDSVRRQLSKRDQSGNTDVFSFFIDTYNDDLNAFMFAVTAAGVQIDQRISPAFGGDSDDGGPSGLEWDAVWESHTKVLENGWRVEMKIPYAAIRFPKKDVQTWGINFSRTINRLNEESWWNPVDPQVNGLVNQFGDLAGVRDIVSPVRLSVMPYVSGYLQNDWDPSSGQSENSWSLNGGMDVKYGINESFTLDMTLIPDFGQVQSDNRVLNLSPFEVQYNENRQFFTEGAEIFSKGGIFYSRRIGARPSGFDAVYNMADPDEEVIKNPAETQLLNATKLSGRTRSGLGIGVFNALAGNEYAILRDAEGITREVRTEPLTNYNEVVFDQNLRHNSYITFLNTNVFRQGTAYDANVTGTTFSLNNKTNTYNVSGTGFLSQKYHTGFRQPEIGHNFSVSAGKTSGKFVYNAFYEEKSNTYDPNDMGFLLFSNSRDAGAMVRYNQFKPFSIFNNLSTNISVNYSRMYTPDVFANFQAWYNFNATLRNFWSFGVWTGLEPVITYDYFEPRVAGRYYTFPRNYNVGGWASTNSAKAFAASAWSNYRIFEDEDRRRLNFGADLRLRVTDKLAFSHGIQRYDFRSDVGFAGFLADSILFGRRDQITWENVFSASYIFTNRIGLTCRVRHYWSTADYQKFYLLGDRGELLNTSYDGIDAGGNSLHNASFNAFNVDMVFTWRFAPGSEMNIVWKNSIYSFSRNLPEGYFVNFGNTLSSPQTNSFSVKILYYLDYLMVKKWVKG